MPPIDASMLVFREFPQLYTQRLILRQINAVDRAAIFRIYSDEEVTRYNAIAQLNHISDAETLIDGFQEQYRTRTAIWWGVTLKDKGTVIGTCGFHNWTRAGLYAHSANIGYGMARVYWRHGYTTEALRALLTFGFSTMQLNRIQADLMTDNLPSMRLLEKLGFQVEGVMRERGFWKDEFHDLHHFALLKRDWEP